MSQRSQRHGESQYAKNVNHGLGEVTNNHLHLNFYVLGLLLGQPQALRVSQFCTLDHYWTFQPISYKMFAFGSSKEIEAKYHKWVDAGDKNNFPAIHAYISCKYPKHLLKTSFSGRINVPITGIYYINYTCVDQKKVSGAASIDDQPRSKTVSIRGKNLSYLTLFLCKESSNHGLYYHRMINYSHILTYCKSHKFNSFFVKRP